MPRNEGSDSLTTKYIDRFRLALEQRNVPGVNNDPYIRHYSSLKHSPGEKLSIQIEPSFPPLVKPTTSDWAICEKLNLADRNLLCMDHSGNQIVVGGADHALRVVRISNDKKLSIVRTLYSKRSGHTEWVTCALFLPGHDRIASGAMDSKICLWNGAYAKDLLGHSGSISKLLSLGEDCLASTSYDRSVKIWCTRTCKLLSSLHGHTGAVLDIVSSGKNSIVTAGRDGCVRVWDINQGAQVWKYQAHSGHATCLVSVSPGLFMSGGSDGKITCLDQRSPKIIRSVSLSDSGAAVAGLLYSEETGSSIAASTDSTVTVINTCDFTAKSRWSGDHTCHIYSMALMKGGIVATGGGEGFLSIRSDTGEKLAGVKVDSNAIRGLTTVSNGTVVLATDDGNLFTI